MELTLETKECSRCGVGFYPTRSNNVKCVNCQGKHYPVGEKKEKPNTLRNNKILELREKGYSRKNVALRFGISSGQVSVICREARKSHE